MPFDAEINTCTGALKLVDGDEVMRFVNLENAHSGGEETKELDHY